jgi:hypothetical protein
MVKWHLGRRKRFLLIAVLILAVVLPLAAFQVLERRYPQVAIRPDDSNLSIRGVINSIEENHKAEGMGAYHIFRYYLRVNISEIVWAENDLANWINGTNLLSVGNIVEIGYDYLDKPQIAVGQMIECKGFYEAITDTPQSLRITIAPVISESYLKPQI